MFVPEILKDIGFGTRQLTLSDFESACQKLKIIVLYVPLSFGGIAFSRIRGRRLIALDKNCSVNELLIRAWHEFAHLECGHDGVRLFLPNALDKAEVEADNLALCAVIPTEWVKTRTFEDLLEDGFTWEQIWQRKLIFERHQI